MQDINLQFWLFLAIASLFLTILTLYSNLQLWAYISHNPEKKIRIEFILCNSGKKNAPRQIIIIIILFTDKYLFSITLNKEQNMQVRSLNNT